jgi:filamentous hemagglutinin family protein
LGTTRGANLFHSFQVFDLYRGESATFTGPANIANLISRVTGGQVSSIDGLRRSEVGNADFFFIDPAGVIFGPNVQVNYPAAFHVSTADELRFSDGRVDSATKPESSSLSRAAPESFDFLSPQPASIQANGSL